MLAPPPLSLYVTAGGCLLLMLMMLMLILMMLMLMMLMTVMLMTVRRRSNDNDSVCNLKHSCFQRKLRPDFTSNPPRAQIVLFWKIYLCKILLKRFTSENLVLKIHFVENTLLKKKNFWKIQFWDLVYEGRSQSRGRSHREQTPPLISFLTNRPIAGFEVGGIVFGPPCYI